MLESLESSPFSVWVRSELLGWPLALTIHAFGTALLVGFVFLIGLRLLGLFEMLPYTSLNRLFPVIWLGIAIQFLSGFVLWATKPTQYVADSAFVLKIALMVIGIILTLYFQGTIRREAASWQEKGAVSSRGIKIVAATLVVWSGVLIAGRFTAYLGSIYLG